MKQQCFLSYPQSRKFHAADHSKFLSAIKSTSSSGGKIFAIHHEKQSISEIVIDNLSRHNAIDGSMMNDFASIAEDIIHFRKPLAIILRGNGKYFCSGADLTLTSNELNTSEKGLEMSNLMTDILHSIRNADLLSVCVINGPALGGGSELITACDFRIMHANAYVQSVHARIGVVPGWGGANRLLSIVGRKNTLRLLGTSAKVYCDEALQIGLVDNSYSGDSSSIEPAMILLQPYLDQPYSSAIRGIKRILASSDTASVINVSQKEKEVFGELWAGPDNKSAIEQFLKRKFNN